MIGVGDPRPGKRCTGAGTKSPFRPFLSTPEEFRAPPLESDLPTPERSIAKEVPPSNFGGGHHSSSRSPPAATPKRSLCLEDWASRVGSKVNKDRGSLSKRGRLTGRCGSSRAVRLQVVERATPWKRAREPVAALRRA